MYECARRLAAAYAAKEGARATDNIAGRPAVDLLVSDLAKLDRVKAKLVRHNIFPGANRAFVVRAIVRWSPGGAALAPAVGKFLEDIPNKPRGLSKLRLARKAKANG